MTEFKEGKIIEIFYAKKKGKKVPVIIRYPKRSDLKEIWKFYNKVIKETENLSRISPVSLKDEKKWLDNVLSGLKKNDKVQLLAECEGKMIGSVSIDRETDERRKYVGGFGICVLQEFTGMGLGKRLMIGAEKESKKTNLRVLRLGVYGRNKIAQSLYKKMGFVSVGKIPGSIKIRKGFDDEIIMYKVLKK